MPRQLTVTFKAQIDGSEAPTKVTATFPPTPPPPPPPFPQTGLVSWFDPSIANQLFQDTAGAVPAVNDGDTVKLWKDHWTNHNDVKNANAGIVLNLAKVNGLNAVRFNGSHGLISLASASLQINSLSICMVMRKFPGVNLQNLGLVEIGNGVSQSSGSMTIEGASGNQAQGTAFDNSGNQTLTTGGITHAGDEFITITLNGSTGEVFVYQDGTQVAHTGAGFHPNFNAPAFLSLGTFLNDTSSTNAWLGEILIYDHVLSPTDRASAESYLKGKWVRSAFDLTNCVLWLDPAVQSYKDTTFTVLAADGDQIKSWRDQSGNHNDAVFTTATNGPTRGSAGGLPAGNHASYTGNTWLNLGQPADFPGAGANLSLYWTQNLPVAGIQISHDEGGGPGTHKIIMTIPSSVPGVNSGFFIGSSSNENDLSSNNGPGGFSVWGFRLHNATFEFFNNEQANGSGAHALAIPSIVASNWHLGESEGFFSNTMAVSDIIMFNTDIPDTQQDHVQEYLLTKHQLG